MAVMAGARGAPYGLLGSVALVFLDHFLRRAEGVDAGRYAGIHGAVEQGFADFLDGAAVVQRAAHVALEFLRALQRGQRSHCLLYTSG